MFLTSATRGKSLPAQISEQLRELIRTGELPATERLPSEPELASRLKVSRASLREALTRLERDGLISRRPGKGTYVTDRRGVGNRLNRNSGITSLIRADGRVPGTKAFSIASRSASSEEIRELDLDAGASVIELERVRTADGRPVVFSVHVIPFHVPDLLERLKSLGEGGSVFVALERSAGVVIHHGIATVGVEVPPRRVPKLLGVEPDSPLLCFRQIDFNGSGQPVLKSISYHNPTAFQVTLYRDGPGPST